MRILALDYGRKYTGVAISDPEETVAFPRGILLFEDHFYEKLGEIVKEESIGLIIVGWPLSLGGNETAQTKETGEFIQELEKTLKIPVKKMDERWTSKQAEKLGGDHSTAAQIILQSYLDKNTPD
jgi:putative holliday junction resolvase